ncbi:MAG: hypothetical protein KIS94_06485 [Chitinophagales bacterium]|nr:hypothetical protein [Chitinophagales bacterium]
MKRIILFGTIAVLFASCKNLVPYTNSMKQQYGWSNEEVKKIQFYVSHDIVLQRDHTQGSTEIVHGKIKTVKGKKIEEIIIPRGTKGVVTQIPRENKLLVSFEMSDDYYLSFGVNPNMGDKYVLLASEWNNGVGKVTYSGREYWTDPDSKYAYLLVDLRKIQKLELKQRVAKGRKVN